jgi:hypothetical protein
MNLRQLVPSFFRQQTGDRELSAVRASGEEDGRKAATAYCDGFLKEASAVFEERLTAFRDLETEMVTEEELPKLPVKRRGLTTKGTK